MRRKVIASSIVACFIVIVAVGLVFRRRQAQNERVFRVGVILSLTGPADFIGRPERDVLTELASDYARNVHGRPRIELVIRDSAGRVEQARDAFDRFVRDPSILAIIGPSTSGESIALVERPTSAPLPILSLAASRQIVYDSNGVTRRYAFKFAQNDDLAARRLIGAMVRADQRRVALLYSNDGFGKSGGAAFRSVLSDVGGFNLVHSAEFPAGLSEPDSQVASIRSDVDAVVIWGTSPGPALLVKALRRAGRNVQVYLSHGNASEDFITSTGPAAENAVVVGSRVLLRPDELHEGDPADTTILRFQEFWRQRFHTPPSHFGGHARDAFVALEAAIRSSSHPTRESIRGALERTSAFPGVTGTFTFDSTNHAGLTEQAFELYRIVGSRFVPYRP